MDDRLEKRITLADLELHEEAENPNEYPIYWDECLTIQE
jgi:hypothetical protein